MKKFLFSIIVPTWKRKNKLFKIIKKINLQINKNQKIEIIISDSGTPGLKNYIKKIIKKFNKLNIKYINCNRNSNALKRNKGLEIAKGKNIIFLDDDCLPSNDFIKIYSNLNQFESICINLYQFESI